MRVDDLKHFYALLGAIEQKTGGRRVLADCSARLAWPSRGVYFFFEPGEERTDSGTGSRVVRVGTHAVRTGSASTLWRRLQAHRSGNHRASSFRSLVGSALIARDGLGVSTWERDGARSPNDVEQEKVVEVAVSAYLSQTTVLWLPVGDPPGASSQRAWVERNSVALLSNAGSRAGLDPPSSGWLGRRCPDPSVRASGLWCVDHVERVHDPAFLDDVTRLIESDPVERDPTSAGRLLEILRERTKPGDAVRTLAQGKENRVVALDDEGILVRTGTSATPQRVPWAWIEGALDELARTGAVAAPDIPGRGRYRSTFILALIASKLSDRVLVGSASPVVIRLCERK